MTKSASNPLPLSSLARPTHAEAKHSSNDGLVLATLFTQRWAGACVCITQIYNQLINQ